MKFTRADNTNKTTDVPIGCLIIPFFSNLNIKKKNCNIHILPVEESMTNSLLYLIKLK